MNFTVPTAALKAALAPVARAAATRAANPVLTGAKLEVSGSTLTLTGTDLDLTVRTSTQVTNGQDGVVVVPAQLLAQLVGSFAGAEVSCTTNAAGDQMTLKSGLAQSKLRTMSAEDFPPFSKVEGTTVSLSGSDLTDVLGSVLYAVSSDESRGAIAGVCVDTSQNPPVVVATDSLRMAATEMPAWSSDTSEAEPVIVPRRLVAEIARLATAAPATITISENLIEFESDGVSVSCRRISGSYPQWRPLLDGERSHVIKLASADVVDVLKRVDPLAKGTNYVELTIKGSSAQVTATGAAGSISDQIAVTAEEEPFTIRVNPRYLADAVANLGSAIVEIHHTGDATKPLELRREGSTSARSLVMPIRIV